MGFHKISSTLVSKRYIAFLLLSIMLLCSFATSKAKKGCSGKYYIQGIAYLGSNEVLSGKTINVSLGEEEILIETDKKGNFELPVSWTNACKSGISPQEHKEMNKRINPEYIYFRFDDIQVKLPNKWQDFAHCIPDSKESVTWHKNLHFD